jgi:hypothetical protein
MAINIISGADAVYRAEAAKRPDAAPMLSGLRPIEADRSMARRLSPEELATTRRGLLAATSFAVAAALPADAGDNGASKIWGNVEVRGKVVAQIYNSGLMVTRSGYDLPAEGMRSDDPAVRAQAMIAAYGGRLVKRDQMADPTLFRG